MLFMQTPTADETLEQGGADHHQVLRVPPVGRQWMGGEKPAGEVVGCFSSGLWVHGCSFYYLDLFSKGVNRRLFERTLPRPMITVYLEPWVMLYPTHCT